MKLVYVLITLLWYKLCINGRRMDNLKYCLFLGGIFRQDYCNYSFNIISSNYLCLGCIINLRLIGKYS